MEKVVLDANINLQMKLYEDDLNEFKTEQDKEKLIINKYKNHNMRFCVIICRNIAIERNDSEYANFLNSIIDSMTHEISMLNKSMLNGNIDAVLKQFTFHEKVNIIFYVRPNFYDKEFEPYEILNDETLKKLSNSIIKEANSILKKYNKNLKEIKEMNKKDVQALITDEDLNLDILFATELIK